MKKMVICKGCGERSLHYAKGVCRKCYDRMRTPKIITCSVCGEEKPYYAKGMCHTCYDHETGRCKPMSENKSCGIYLGCYVAERVLSKVFKNVEVMPHGNPGYDFICGKGFKIDVKSACLNTRGGWAFIVKHNIVADYFLCLAFDNRDELNPMHIWLLPGNMVNHLSGLSICPSTIEKWCEYELDIDQVNIQCDLLR